MMKPIPASDSDLNTDAYKRRFRNQATGTGNTLVASEEVGKMRSQRVIDGAPTEMARLAQGYPQPHPEMDVNGTLRDRLTGKKWKQLEVGPHL